MPDDKSSKDTSIPPPLDPFPTYQTPYPRSNNNNPAENPFIQFRRFADEQFSSFFQGIPNLFGVQSKDVDDLMRRRHELEEGWRKQFEQEMEEMRHEIEKSRIAAIKAMEDSWSRSTEPVSKPSETTEQSPWWTRGNASKCPALNGQRPQQNARKCPALYDEAGQAKTELDLYEAPATSKAQPTNSDVLSSTGGPWLHWLTPGDIKSKEKAAQQTKKASDEHPFPPATRYSLFKARHMNPFENPDHTIPWLMLSPYSPIYLCNPGQSRMFRVRIQDSEEVPLQISRPKYFERWYTEVDDKLARQLPWADAFEDLVSLQQTGSMVDRNYSTLRTPPTWIHDMVSRGSLGDRWGFNDDGMLIKRSNGTPAVETATTLKDRCRWRKERRWGSWGRAEDAQKESEHEEKEKQEDSIDKLVDDLPEYIARSPVFGSLLSTADSIVSAVEQGIEDVLKQNQEQSATSSDKAAATESEEPDSTPYTSLADSSSSPYSYTSNTSSSYSSSSDQEPGSIISTLTTTVTRTLPDGSVETKRVFKKRFADGTEESDESTEVKNAPTRPTSVMTEVSDKETQTQPLGISESLTNQPHRPAQLDPESADRIRNTYGGQAFRRDHDEVPRPSKAPAENPQGRRGGGWFWTR